MKPIVHRGEGSRTALWGRSLLWSLFSTAAACLLWGSFLMGLVTLQYLIDDRPIRLEKSIAAWFHAVVVVGFPWVFVNLLMHIALPRELRLRHAFGIRRRLLGKFGCSVTVTPSVSTDVLKAKLRKLIPILLPDALPQSSEDGEQFLFDRQLNSNFHIGFVECSTGELELSVTKAWAGLRIFTPVLAMPASVLAAILVVLERLCLIRESFDYPEGPERFAADLGSVLTERLDRAIADSPISHRPDESPG